MSVSGHVATCDGASVDVSGRTAAHSVHGTSLTSLGPLPGDPIPHSPNRYPDSTRPTTMLAVAVWPVIAAREAGQGGVGAGSVGLGLRRGVTAGQRPRWS